MKNVGKLAASINGFKLAKQGPPIRFRYICLRRRATSARGPYINDAFTEGEGLPQKKMTHWTHIQIYRDGLKGRPQVQ